MRSIAELGDALCAAYARRGVPVADNLNPGLKREQIIDRISALGMQAPEELIALYQWRNGTIDEDDPKAPTLCFRDNIFVSIDRGIEEISESMVYYQEDSTLEIARVDLFQCFPIAAFMGSTDVVACGQHLHSRASAHPVIRVFQGVDLYYHSITTMLETCIDWVNAPEWKHLSGLPRDVEQAIWRRHNPGIFED